MTIKVRFAPSPTGVLHIGSVRTALFNWLYARHFCGKFYLRIEDTDKLRSTAENTELIFKILKWLNFDWDDEPVIQSARINRHKEVAELLVKNGKAYYCYCTQEEIEAKREEAKRLGLPYKYDGKCRNNSEPPKLGTNPVIRLKAENNGETTVNDLVQGPVTVQNSQMDDLILIRSDGSPTYMLSVVVDDHDMGITHVIRGDDHLTNTFRQVQIYKACNWNIPEFAHIPLIYGPDGAKLSKRHGAVSAIDYMNLGFLPEAINNYLMRLGWSHGDDEIISIKDAISWFDIKNVGKSPSRFDMVKLENLNAHYIKARDNISLFNYMTDFISVPLDNLSKDRIIKGLNSLKERSKTIVDLAASAMIYVQGPDTYDEKCNKYASEFHLNILKEIIIKINNGELNPNDESELCTQIKLFAKEKNIKLIEIAQALRAALCGKLTSPSVFEIITILGPTETIKRIEKFILNFEQK